MNETPEDIIEGFEPDEWIELVGEDGIEWDGEARRARSYIRQAWAHDKAYGREPRYLNARTPKESNA